MGGEDAGPGTGVGLEPSRGTQNAVFRAYRYGPEHTTWLRRERY
ncbi:hypothetical protein [Streptomyces sp. NWU339]|nr:hypothetical protein [Streptomyces sp. NWU339]